MKLKYVILSICVGLVSVTGITAQEAAQTRADQMPTFPGCEVGDLNCSREKLNEFVRIHIKMPEAAMKAKTGGVAMVAFVVGKNGSIADIKLKKDPGHGMGQEAVRIVEKMQKEKIKWKAGVDEGKKVPVQMVLPVAFNTSLPEPDFPADEHQPEEAVYTAVEDMPRFNGCGDVSADESKNCTFNQLVKYMQTNLKYPAEAIKEKTEGTVMTSFIINEGGQIEDVMVLKGLTEECDAEAERIIQEMPVWVPGKQDGKAVKVQMNLPIQFKLSKTPAPGQEKEKKQGNN